MLTLKSNNMASLYIEAEILKIAYFRHEFNNNSSIGWNNFRIINAPQGEMMHVSSIIDAKR